MPQPGLEPGPSDPESSTLTTGLLTPHTFSNMVGYPLSDYANMLDPHMEKC